MFYWKNMDNYPKIIPVTPSSPLHEIITKEQNRFQTSTNNVQQSIFVSEAKPIYQHILFLNNHEYFIIIKIFYMHAALAMTTLHLCADWSKLVQFAHNL